jgi:3-deoxy-7-phosphoheptulonate synthase
MKPDATETDVERVIEMIEKLGFRSHELPGASRIAIGITGNPARLTRRILKICPASPMRFA